MEQVNPQSGSLVKTTDSQQSNNKLTTSNNKQLKRKCVRSFRCTWPDCGRFAREKPNLKQHIYGVHFRIPTTKKKQAAKNVTAEWNGKTVNEFIEEVPGADINWTRGLKSAPPPTDGKMDSGWIKLGF